MAFKRIDVTIPKGLLLEVKEEIPTRGLSGLISRLLRKWVDEKKKLKGEITE